MSKFEDKFLGILDEDIGDSVNPSAVTGEGDAEAFQRARENPEDGIEMGMVPGIQGSQGQYEEMIEGWVSKLQAFSKFLNDPKDSMYRDLSDMDKADTKYEGVSKDALKIITRIAQDLGTLEPILTNVQHVVRSEDPAQNPLEMPQQPQM